MLIKNALRNSQETTSTTLVGLMHTMYALREWIKWVINFRAALLNLWELSCKTVKLQNCITSYMPTNQVWVMYFKKAPEYLEGGIVLDPCLFPTYLKAGGLQLQPFFVISCSLLLLSQRKSDKRRNVRYKLRLHPLFPCSFLHGKIAMSETSVQLWKWWLLDINSIRNLCSFVSGRGESAV